MSRRSRRSSADRQSRGSQAGYSALEALVAVAIALSLMAGALSLAMSSKHLNDTDQARGRLNESLRASAEFLITDLRQVGERLGQNFPAIVITRGEDLPGGSAGDPDELRVRRNLHDTVLRVCEDVDPTLDDVVIAVKSGGPAGCAAASAR